MNSIVRILSVTAFLVILCSDADAFLREGRIDGTFSYNKLSLYDIPGGCVLRGVIENRSKKTHMGVEITLKAFDGSGHFIGEHTIRVPTLSGGSAHTFEDKIIGCEKVNPRYFTFEIQK